MVLKFSLDNAPPYCISWDWVLPMTHPSTPLCERDSQGRLEIITIKAQESLYFVWASLHLKEVKGELVVGTLEV